MFLAGNDLPRRWKTSDHFHIAELGFGTGLNFLETWRQWCRFRRPDQHLDFTSFEAYPLEVQALIRAISAWPDLSEPALKLAKLFPDLTSVPTSWAMDAQTTLTIVKAPAVQGVCGWNKKAQAWYLDGFSPDKNPDMWSSELMSAVYAHTLDGGTFSTYTAAGWVRRNLQSSGFSVKKTPGHAGKRHMLVGVR